MSPTEADAVLRAEGLTIRYGRRTALENVALAVPAGAVSVLLGRNGAGKSSLVRCALGQQRPSHGHVTLFGRDAWRSRRAVMRRVGVVPETPDAPPEMTPAALAAFCARLYPAWNAEQVRERLARFEVPGNVPFERLSKGQRGTVMLALALGHSPDLLILDDPTLGLDALARRAFYDELLGELADRGTTVFITTHDLAGIEGIADRVTILRDRQVVVDERLETLKARFRRLRLSAQPSAPSPFRVAANGSSTWGSDLVVSDFDDVRFEAWRATQPGEVTAEPMPLEDIFVAVVGTEKGGPQ